MFGGPLELPKLPKHRKPKPQLHETDVFMPHGSNTYRYAHRGREPNTDYSTKLMQYKQRDLELEEKKHHFSNLKVKLEETNLLHQRRAEKNRFRAKIQDRLNEKLAHYEESLEQRKDRLRDLLGQEERDFIKETVDTLQRADESKVQDKKARCNILRAQKEAERLELVKQKRIQQYADRCMEIRPFLAQKRLEETKIVQLQQIRENEARREAERELDKMWEDIMRKQREAMFDRETQEALHKYQRDKKDKEVLDMQVMAKKLLEEERKSIEQSDREEMEKLIQRLKQQEDEDRKALKENREREARELKEQLRMQEEFREQRKKEEQALQDAFKKLADLEMERASMKQTNQSTQRKYQVATYREHLKDLAEVRKLEEAKADEVVEKYRQEELKRTYEKECKIVEAKRKLTEEVIEGRKQQIEYRKQEAQRQLKLKQEENNLYRTILETNKKLNDESQRLSKIAVKRYRSDLKKQIDYNALLRSREKVELEKKLQQGIEEELKYEKLVEEILFGKSWADLQIKHPFRKVLEQFDCDCSKKSK